METPFLDNSDENPHQLIPKKLPIPSCNFIPRELHQISILFERTRKKQSDHDVDRSTMQKWTLSSSMLYALLGIGGWSV